MTGAYVERGTGNNVQHSGAGGNMEGYYGPPPPPRPISFQAPHAAPKTVQIPVYDGHDQDQGQARMKGEMNEKHE